MSPAHAAGAASVAAQLRAFMKEPASHRGQIGAGRSSLEAGHHVFKFAQGKFPPDMPTPEREELQCAAVAFVREVCLREGASHYQMLCVPADAKREAIKENYHLLMALIHPDRAGSAREAWPAECAQRANRAYMVLDDAAARSIYDKSLNAFTAPPPSRLHRPPRRRTGKSEGGKARVARAMLVLAAAVSTLVMLYAWIADFQDEHYVFSAGTRGRDIAASPERPRFLGANVLAAREVPRVAFTSAQAESFTLLPSLWPNDALAPGLVTETVTSTPVTRRTPVPESEPASAVREASMALAAADSGVATPSEAPALAPVAREPRLSSAQIEVLVARLIGYYEAGETDNLIALLDPKEAGLTTLRIRQAYTDFFRSTRERRLRLKKLDWQSGSTSAQAQGQATVLAEYVDAPGNLEREIDVEMEIALRNGQPRITHLTLFPGAL